MMDEEFQNKLKMAKKPLWKQFILPVCALVLLIAFAVSMVIAWYTNIARAGDLTFKTKAWGIDSSAITVGESGVSYFASPGSSGVVSLNVDNTTGNKPISAKINIDKREMDEEIQKRIFFYADTSKAYEFEENSVKSFETVNKIWLGNDETESISYNIEAYDSLHLDKDYHSDVPIKWMWVYDCVGYYFRGTVSQAGASIVDYISPIEYNLDDAVFSLENDQADDYEELIRIGNKTKAEYLKSVFDNDGYIGTLEIEPDGSVSQDAYVKTESQTFYKVCVDQSGTGVWAYLCNYSEVLYGTDFDSTLSFEENFGVTINVSVINTDTLTHTVTTPEELTKAIEDKREEIITLGADMFVSSPISIPSNASVRIDLDGHDLLYNGSEDIYSLFYVPDSSSLRIGGGSLTGKGLGGGSSDASSSVAVQTVGGTAVITDVVIRDFDTAVMLSDQTVATDGSVKINKCDITTRGASVLVYGNGYNSSGISKAIVLDSNIKSGYIGICGRETNPGGSVPACFGTEIIINGSTIEGTETAVYHYHQRSSAVICGSVLKGATGLVSEGGNITITDTEITATGNHTAAANNSVSFTNTGDGIYLEATHPWAATIKISGTSTKITSEKSYAVEAIGAEDGGNASIRIDNGSVLSGLCGTINANAYASITSEN